MFEFLEMADNYEERKIDRYEDNELTIDTAWVNDSEQPCETAITHRAYNDNKWVIVELYDTKEQAQKGHDKWVGIMTSGDLPLQLRDVSTASIALLLGDEIIYERGTL